jgi:cell division protein FtsL
MNLHRRDVMAMAIVIVLILTYYSVRWQPHQRKLLRENQQILARIASRRGWFGKDGLPDEWKNWGHQRSSIGSHKAVVTVLFGLLEIVAVWFVAKAPATSRPETISVKIEK